MTFLQIAECESPKIILAQAAPNTKHADLTLLSQERLQIL